jgi:hypothetical protein
MHLKRQISYGENEATACEGAYEQWARIFFPVLYRQTFAVLNNLYVKFEGLNGDRRTKL